MVWLQCTGKHNIDEVNTMINEDLSAISILLGEFDITSIRNYIMLEIIVIFLIILVVVLN